MTRILFRPSPGDRRRRRWLMFTAVAVVLGLIAWLFYPTAERQATTPNVLSETKTTAATEQPSGPPWRYGNPDARFTVIVHADLECPFCQSYTPALRQWIDTQTDVNLQWQHLPLPIHEPAATQHAIWAECMGETFGQSGFWDAVAWIYAHTRGDGQGLPPDVAYPAQGSPEQQQRVSACVSGAQPAAMISAQAQEAMQAGINATPSLRLIDHASERSMTLTGPVTGDALLSALDLLASPDTATSESSADAVGDRPR
ncbi:MAG: DsbA family protein [Desulfobulbus sp.]|nr:DsbA family protein [Desulfobulbus sp.]